ncbi:glycosyltransferase [Kyrpidia spormannii]|uniref:Glycosyltransferase n=1 Tax=Kyrpidia spormannii TaxID=2055160 RepID=A0A2K8N5V9_9BACL|nr:glycosyltransferase family 4 protein [Kyrpidia spormannii]ATY83852.1 glycosyltransferase [Kyrpidia spormannii]
MRVVVIALSVGGAMGQYVSELARGLSGKVELYVFAPSHYEYAEGIDRLHCFYMGETRGRRLLHLLNILEAWCVWRRIKALEPDVIHLFNGEGYPWGLFFAWASRKAGVPLLVTLHDPEPHPGNVWESLNARMRGFTLKQATAIHIHTARFKPLLAKQGIDETFIHIIPHGSLARRFLKHREQGIQREPIVLFFGRLEAYKGLDILVEAGLALKGKVRVVIAGPGNLETEILQKIKEHPDVFELHNRFLDDKEVAHLFQWASVCVLPYKHATQSSVPLIAAAFNVPVVATSLGGFIEDVPRVNGVLVPPGDVNALVAGIGEALHRRPVYPRELEFDSLADSFMNMYMSILR